MYCSIFLVSHVPCCSACFIIFRGIALFRIVTSGVCKRHADTRTSKRRVTAPSRPTTVFVFMVLSVIFEHLTFGQIRKTVSEKWDLLYLLSWFASFIFWGGQQSGVHGMSVPPERPFLFYLVVQVLPYIFHLWVSKFEPGARGVDCGGCFRYVSSFASCTKFYYLTSGLNDRHKWWRK